MVTWHTLLCAVAIIIGTLTTAYGALTAWGAGMSDAPPEGSPGCSTFLVGGALIVGGIVALFL